MNRVIHFEIQANDTDRAMKFYKDVFGWEVIKAMSKDNESGGGMDYWTIKTGDLSTPGINGGLYKRPRKTEEKNYLFDCTIEVLDIDRAISDVKASGGRILKEKMELPKVGWFARAKDTEGNLFALLQPTEWKPM